MQGDCINAAAKQEKKRIIEGRKNRKHKKCEQENSRGAGDREIRRKREQKEEKR